MQYGFDSYIDAVARGLVPGVTRVAALGFNVDIDTGTTPEDAWPGGGIYPWPTADTAMELFCASANDTALGSGCRVVTIQGIDYTTREAVTIVQATNGDTVALPRNLYRVNVSVGDGSTTGSTTNDGEIQVRKVGDPTQVYSIIPAGVGMSQQANYTVPAGFTLILYSIEIAVNAYGGTQRSVDAATFFRSDSGFYRLPRKIQASDFQPYNLPLGTRIRVAEKTDFNIRIMAASANNTPVSGSWEGLLYRNT